MAAHQHILSPGMVQQLRRLAIFLAMLMSGGSLIFPRVPLLIAILGLCFLIKGPTFGVRRELGFVAVVLIGVFIVAVAGADGFNAMAVVTRFANFIAGIALLSLYLDQPSDTLARDVQPIFRWMGLQIIGTVLLAALVPQVFTTISIEDANYQTFLYIFTYHNLLETTSLLVRPDGFFFEPGVFQIYMNIYLFIALFMFRSRYDIPLALIGLALLQSTTGILITCLLLAAAYARRFGEAQHAEKFLVMLAAPFLAIPLIFFAAQNVNDKFNGEMRGSSWAREYDLRTGLNIIAAHPLVGVGFDNERYKREAARLGYDQGELDFRSTVDRSSSNGLVSLVASIGIPMSIPFLIALFRQRFFGQRLLFGGILVLSFLSEAIMLTPFFLMLMFSAMLAVKRRAPNRAAQGGRQQGDRNAVAAAGRMPG